MNWQHIKRPMRFLWSQKFLRRDAENCRENDPILFPVNSINTNRKSV
jgi:hypothetical protein